MRFSVRFVCQGGGLDRKAAVLAASLRRNLVGDHELIAAVPSDPWFEPPDPEVVAFLDRLGVRREPIESPICREYPIGNKLACLLLPTSCDKRVFLDSDVLCT